MRKAFSVVELVVVLLVISVIIAMGFKGKEALDAAQMRKEAHKIDKFSNAVATLVALSTTATIDDLELADPASETLSLNTFFQLELLTDVDLMVEGNNYQWELRRCNQFPPTDTVFSRNGTMVCAYHPHLFLDLICTIETAMDDKNIKNGRGVASGDNLSTFNYNCQQVDAMGTLEDQNKLPKYSYIVHK
jgi:hypothetical protein